ncbi:MAG TPA: hypothetical protein VEM40_11260 [Nitrospirota bacterium]|nr:hypothetical protein [Nitrospirota bacterium]
MKHEIFIGDGCCAVQKESLAKRYGKKLLLFSIRVMIDDTCTVAVQAHPQAL